MSTRTLAITAVKRKLNLTATNEILTDANEIGDAVDEAVKKYSQDKPRQVIDQFAGQDEYDYDIANLLASWIDDFSVISDIEFPAGDQTADLIEDIDWEVYKPDSGTYGISNVTSGATQITLSTASNALFFKQHDCIYINDATKSEVNWASADGNTTTGVVTLKNAASQAYTSPTVSKRKVLRFINDDPDTDDVARVIYSTTHTLSDSVDTIPTTDYAAVVNLAVGFSAYILASHFSKAADSSIGGDAVEYAAKAAIWREQGDKFIALYKEHLGIRDGEPSFASETKDWDTAMAWGMDYLFHRKRWR